MQNLRIRQLIPFIGALLIAVGAPELAEARIDGKEASQSSARSSSEGVVNINTATAAQLTLLPGVGPSRAEAIIRARQNRPFRTVNELARVRGIGRATLRSLRPYVTTNGETTLSRSIPMQRRER